MNHYVLTFTLIFLGLDPVFGQADATFRIDPLTVAAFNETQNIARTLPQPLFPGWDFSQTPTLLYRPNVQDVLLNFPRAPEGFSRITPPFPVGDYPVYVRNDETHFSIDGQNTRTTLDGVSTLVVADRASQMRSQLRAIAQNQNPAFISGWLDDWNFLSSPYSALGTILHEAFHVYQHQQAPDKGANEMVVARYPVLDATNNALHKLEGFILRDALRPSDRDALLEHAKTFVAVRQYRQARLDSAFVAYENLNEYSEGIAKYIEYVFFQQGTALTPTADMWLYDGFSGYGSALTEHFDQQLDFAVRLIAGDENMGMGRYGAGPLRFKLYQLGAMQALLLDALTADWHTAIFDPHVYLSDLLAEAVALTPTEATRYRERAFATYNFADLLRDKETLADEGHAAARAKRATILETPHTLVQVHYGAVGEDIRGMGFTPFGVTQVGPEETIYEMVPITAAFAKGVRLEMRLVTPLLVNEAENIVSFALETPLDDVVDGTATALDVDPFRLAETTMRIERQDRTLHIYLVP